MERYRFRLEDPNSEHFRIVSLVAESEEAAREVVMRREQQLVDFELPADDLALLEQQEKQGDIVEPSPEFGLLHLHRQEEPYAVVEVASAPVELPEGGDQVNPVKEAALAAAAGEDGE